MNQFYEKIIEIVHETKKFIVETNLKQNIKEKGPSDFVTDVDLNISNFLNLKLYKIAPNIGFMSEEDSQINLSPTRWILDPIDGTTNLIFDYKLSSVSLALLQDNQIVFGVVYNPFSEETFYAEKGCGAFLNGNRIHVENRPLKNCLIEFGAGSTHKDISKENFELGQQIFKNVLDLRRICSSALSICFIASGRLNGYFEKHLKPWDYAAASLILKESGGKLCDWYGNAIQFDKPAGIIAGSDIAFDYLKAEIINAN